MHYSVCLLLFRILIIQFCIYLNDRKVGVTKDTSQTASDVKKRAASVSRTRQDRSVSPQRRIRETSETKSRDDLEKSEKTHRYIRGNQKTGEAQSFGQD